MEYTALVILGVVTVLSVINFVVTWLLVAKVMFSTHQVEYRALEELKTIREGLGLGSDQISVKEEPEAFTEVEDDHELSDFLANASQVIRAKRRKQVLTEE